MGIYISVISITIQQSTGFHYSTSLHNGGFYPYFFPDVTSSSYPSPVVDHHPSNQQALVDLTNWPSPPSIRYWIKDLTLYPTDRATICDGAWLTDNVIDAGMKLLRRAHPRIGGLESTCTQKFDAQRGDFVQILNISRSHWVTVTNIGCKQGHVLLYNSMKSY